MDKIKNLIEKLKKQKFYKNQITKIIEINETLPIFSDDIEIIPEIKQFLYQKNIKLYIHQKEAIEKIRLGHNIIISTPTASGKTLSFNIPILEEIKKNNLTTALYLYPAKALANDQLNTLLEIKEITLLNFNVGIYDGDTPSNTKKILREKANIIISNPYELHKILPFHHKFKRFFQNLKFIIIDEAHRYSGVFGSNIAMLIRRLKRLLKFYGSHPQFIISTASLSNPIEFCQKLTGENFDLINKSGAPTGKKYIIFWDPGFSPEKSVHTQTKDLILFLAAENFQTLCFTTSRKLTELIRIWANAEQKNKVEVLSYRAGYSPEIRREIESKLKEGKIKGVVSTNALELGIDIGQLDIIIISGYPGTISSFWQQAGRAGRKMQESAIFFLPYEDALEKYLLKHPEIITNMNFENAIISIENQNILKNHILCATAELPLKINEKLDEIDISLICNDLLKEGWLTLTPRGYIYSGTKRPHDFVSLDNLSDKNIKIKIDNKILEEITFTRACREAHKGAVYYHQGESYIIKELNIEEGIAIAEKKDVDYYTESLKNEDVKILQTYNQKKFKNFRLFFGKVAVEEIYKEYRIKKSGYVVSYEKLNLPAIKFSSEAIWIELDDSILVKLKNFDFSGALHATEHALIALAPLFAMCEADDLGGVSYPVYENGKSMIFIYDGYEGGIGISKKLFEIFIDLKQKTYDLVKNCECESGCPYCVFSSKCGNKNNPIDKYGAIEILNNLY